MVEVIQGEKQAFTVNVVKKGTTTVPFDLTGFTEITVCFKVGSSVVVKTETGGDVAVVGDPLLGQISVSLTVADTSAMAPGNGDIEVDVEKGAGENTKSQSLDSFIVVASICPLP